MKKILITIFAISNLVMCNEKKSVDTLTTIKTTKMKTSADSGIFSLKNSMEGYMKEFKPSYTQRDIDKCITLLSEYVIEISKTKSKGEGLGVVKSTILHLNSLNAQCQGTLIETNEREQIVGIIILASHEMGYNSADEDITEEWREF